MILTSVKDVSKFRKAHVRVSLKAGTPEDFTRKTGAKAEAFEIPLKAIENLLDSGGSFHVAAMSADPRICGSADLWIPQAEGILGV